MKETVRLGISVVIFLAISLVCISYILTPTEVHVLLPGMERQEIVLAPSALTEDGLSLRAETWKEYPHYNIGLGIAAALGFGGALWSMAGMYAVREKE